MRHILFLITMLLSGYACAEAPRASIEISGSLYNPDWEQRENATGLRISGMWMAGKNIRFRGSYNSIDTNVVPLPVVSVRGLPFSNWREAGVAYIWQLASDTNAEVEVSYQGFELYDNTESGAALLAGISHRLNDRFNATIRLSYFDIESPDWRLTGELFTTLSESVDLVTRIDDMSEFDFTWYEVGLRIRF